MLPVNHSCKEKNTKIISESDQPYNSNWELIGKLIENTGDKVTC